MTRCARHTGDIGPLEPYVPCGKPASCTVNRPVHGGGEPFWSACEKHAREAQDEGCEVEGLGDAANDVDEEEEERTAFLAARKQRIERLYERSRGVLALAYKYRGETVGALTSTTMLADHRIDDCVSQVRLYRLAIARLRSMQPGDDTTTVLVACSNDI